MQLHDSHVIMQLVGALPNSFDLAPRRAVIGAGLGRIQRNRAEVSRFVTASGAVHRRRVAMAADASRSSNGDADAAASACGPYVLGLTGSIGMGEKLPRATALRLLAGAAAAACPPRHAARARRPTPLPTPADPARPQASQRSPPCLRSAACPSSTQTPLCTASTRQAAPRCAPSARCSPLPSWPAPSAGPRSARASWVRRGGVRGPCLPACRAFVRKGQPEVHAAVAWALHVPCAPAARRQPAPRARPSTCEPPPPMHVRAMQAMRAP